MAERPMLMSAPMVRAILDGTKTQTRRALKDHPGDNWLHDGFGRITSKHPKQGRFGLFVRRGVGTDFPEFDIVPCRYGQPGDKLWVREAWRTAASLDHLSPSAIAARCIDAGYRKPWAPLLYDADGHRNSEWRGFDMPPKVSEPGKGRPSIHMPRWASRITLEITGVRVERLQDISEADCVAEGCPGGAGAIPGYAYAATPLEHYHWLWNDINGAGAWELNPWVWALDFKRAA